MDRKLTIIQLDEKTLSSMDVEALKFAANEAGEAVEKAKHNAVEHAIRCGRFLAAAQKKIPHGQWMAWVGVNFDYGRSTAQTYMTLAANYQRAGNLTEAASIREALRLIAETPEAQAKAADRAQRKLAAAPAAPQPAKPTAPAAARRESDAPAGQPPGTMHGESYHTRPLPGSDEAPVAAPAQQSQERQRITTTVPTPREHAPRPMTDTVGQALAGGEWFDHWWWHNPSGHQERVTRADIVAAAEHIGEPKPIVERTLEIFGTADVIRVMVATAGTGKPALDLARQLQKAAEVLLASEGKAPAKATAPTNTVLRTFLADFAETACWTETLQDAAASWAAYKQSLAPADRIRTLDSWHASLKRMAKLAETHGVETVVEMVEKSIANGWTGWEHLDAVKRSPAAVKSGRKTNDDWGIQYETVEG